MQIKITRKSRFVRLNKSELQLIVSALSAAQTQGMEDGTKIEAGDTDAFLLQASVVVRQDDLRGRLVRAVRSL